MDRRVYPAIDINRSGTRRERCYDPKEIDSLPDCVAPLENPSKPLNCEGRREKVPSNAQFLMSRNLD